MNCYDIIVGGYNSTTYLFNGAIDEVRISNKARSAGWISTSYNTMNNTSIFLNVGDEKTQS